MVVVVLAIRATATAARAAQRRGRRPGVAARNTSMAGVPQALDMKRKAEEQLEQQQEEERKRRRSEQDPSQIIGKTQVLTGLCRW